jgi:ABC-2 type transport system permease protein
LWALSTATAVLLSAAIGTLMTISMLWTIAGDGIGRLVPAAAFIFSGMIIPLPLFPDWAQPVLNFLPFRGLADVPFRLYTGHIPAVDGVAALAHQLAWTVALIALGRWLLARGTRRMVVQGG